METETPIDGTSLKADVSAKKLRSLAKAAREALTQEERLYKSRQAFQNLCALPVWQEAQDILAYASFGAELSTWELIDAALQQGKAVWCPKVSAGEKRMEFYRIASASQLESGFRRIPEPSGSGECFLDSKSCRALMVVPGTAFDRQKNRIGYGGGYYDRYAGAFLQENRPVLAGLCFECQIAERIPAEPHDVRMDLIVTEERIIV